MGQTVTMTLIQVLFSMSPHVSVYIGRKKLRSTPPLPTLNKYKDKYVDPGDVTDLLGQS